MKISFFLKNSQTAIVFILIQLFIFNDQLLAQQKSKKEVTKGYGKASYTAEKEGAFFRTWLLAGPVQVHEKLDQDPEEDLQIKIFKEDIITQVQVEPGKVIPSLKIKDKEVNWKLISSEEDIIDLDQIYDQKDFVYAYALAEIIAQEEKNVILAVGSDDGIKIWQNFKLIHDNWIPRGINKDDDLIPIKLKKGSNQILIKVQDIQQGWAFTARLLDHASINDQILKVAGNGDLDKLKFLLANGANTNYISSSGYTPLHIAQINGRTEVIDLLKQNGAKEAVFPQEEAYIDDLYKNIKEKERPGLAILVAKGNRVVYKKGFGFADISAKKQITPETIFRIGSVTKQITAAAILKLQEQNLLHVNDKLSKFIPDFPRGEEVTIHQLLTHISGIHSYTSKPDFINKVTAAITPEDLISSIKKDTYDFNPGEKFMYNNSGYFILGYIIEKVSGKSYADYLKDTFFEPLQMSHSGVHYTGIKLENEAKGFSLENSKYNEAINWDMSWAGAAGALYSTLDDLHKWNKALYSGQVLNEQSLKAAITPVVLNDGSKPGSGDYGYGLAIGKFRGKEVIHHSGGLHGFITQLAYYPQDSLTVAMFSNSNDPEANFDPNKLAEIYLWNELEKQSTYSLLAVVPENIDKFTGRYDFFNGNVMKITREADGLQAQLSGQPKIPIYPSSENEFFWKVVDARIKFIENEKGEVSHALFYQGGQELNVKKLKEEVIVAINPLLIDTYLGKYDFGNDLVVTVFKEMDRLYAQATNQPKFEIFPVSDTDFVLKDLNASITFVKEADGKVNKLVLHMNGTDTHMAKLP
ncbi:hypothetical protein BH23BAC1_BH23BAC1_47420 [soil metagenome]